jgi:hypothetical protein
LWRIYDGADGCPSYVLLLSYMISNFFDKDSSENESFRSDFQQTKFFTQFGSNCWGWCLTTEAIQQRNFWYNQP